MFNLSIDSKLRGCDLVELHVRDISQENQILQRAIVIQRKTHRPVQFEITEQTRDAVTAWITRTQLKSDQFLFPSLIHDSPHISTRQYAKIVNQWVMSIGLAPQFLRDTHHAPNQTTRVCSRSSRCFPARCRWRCISNQPTTNTFGFFPVFKTGRMIGHDFAFTCQMRQMSAGLIK